KRRCVSAYLCQKSGGCCLSGRLHRFTWWGVRFMPIPLQCEKCDKQLRVKDEFAGKKLKCPGCGTMLKIPALPEPEEVEVPVERIPDEEPHHAAHQNPAAYAARHARNRHVRSVQLHHHRHPSLTNRKIRKIQKNLKTLTNRNSDLCQSGSFSVRPRFRT